ncbi:hypothetical protein BC629DRAFT_1443034 [Irpex lacteus]|nr:hypothetical protein BC629DRAFT_1443034 [Irpex lacteus]
MTEYCGTISAHAARSVISVKVLLRLKADQCNSHQGKPGLWHLLRCSPIVKSHQTLSALFPHSVLHSGRVHLVVQSSLPTAFFTGDHELHQSSDDGRDGHRSILITEYEYDTTNSLQNESLPIPTSNTQPVRVNTTASAAPGENFKVDASGVQILSPLLGPVWSTTGTWEHGRHMIVLNAETT